MTAVKISDLIPDISSQTAILGSFKSGFDKIYGTYETDALDWFCDWFKEFVYRRYKDSFILSYYDEERAWNKIYDFYISHINEFQQVEALWKANSNKLMEGLSSTSKTTSKASATPQDGNSYVDTYPDTINETSSSMEQSDKTIFKKLQELTKQLINYKKTWAEMFRKEMGLWIAL